MGVYGSAPKAPDPNETAAAQTGTNVSTAIANSYLGNINQVTPDGNLTYSKTGQNFINDNNGQDYWRDAKGNYTTNKPGKGVTGYTQAKGYYAPTFTATQTLSKPQQAIKGQEDQANLNFATLANTQSGKLNTLLKDPFSIGGAPAAGQASSLQAPSYQQFGNGPQLQNSFGDAGDITRSYGTEYGGNVKEVQDALMARMQPSLDQNRSSLEQKLANQGLQPGSEAYNRAIDSASRQENDARYGAILNAGQEQSRLAGLAQNQASFQNAAQQQAYGQQMGSAEFANSANQQMYQNANTATGANNALQDQGFNAQQSMINAQNTQRSNYLNEQYALRNQQINEPLSLASGAQLSNPNFVPTQGQNIPTVDYAGLVNQNYQNQLGAYNAQQSAIGGALGSVASMFSFSPIKLSDRTAKKDIEEVGKLKGHKLYEYRYKGKHDDGKRHIGVMAQEAEKKRPDAVLMGEDGLRRVDYGKLFAAKGKN